jgi:hypothetical protein
VLVHNGFVPLEIFGDFMDRDGSFPLVIKLPNGLGQYDFWVGKPRSVRAKTGSNMR